MTQGKTQRKTPRKTDRTDRPPRIPRNIRLTFAERSEVASLAGLEGLTIKLLRSAKGALTAKQLAEVLNISPKTIFKLAKAERIPSFRIGTAVRFDPQLIVDWLQKQRRGHTT